MCVDINRVLEDLCFFLDFLDLRVVVRYGAGGKTTVCAVCACSSVCGSLCVLILIFRRALLSTPTCVNTPADQMADNDFQIDTLHSTSRENQWALIAFFPRRSSPPKGYYLSLSLSISLSHSISLSLSPRPIHSPLNTTEIESIHTAFHRGFSVKRYREISV